MAMGSLCSDLRAALDPVIFARERLKFEPDPWQAETMRTEEKNTLLVCSRQAGKSTTTAVMALHKSVYKPNALVLLGSPTLRQSRELFGKVVEFMRQLEPAPILEEDNRLSFTLKNGSRVVSLPGDGTTIRGFSAPDLIIEDEAAYVGDGFYRAIRPMLAVSGGRLILLSTPNGKRGHFYDAHNDDGDWLKIKVPAEKCPRITEEFLKDERATIGEWAFRQEYQCEFVDTRDAVFRSVDIERAITSDVKPLFPVGVGDPNVTPLFEEVVQ
jgi:hypothetical protein